MNTHTIEGITTPIAARTQSTVVTRLVSFGMSVFTLSDNMKKTLQITFQVNEVIAFVLTYQQYQLQIENKTKQKHLTLFSTYNFPLQILLDSFYQIRDKHYYSNYYKPNYH